MTSILAPKTPQQNGVVERRNESFVEMGKILLNYQGLPHKYLSETINTYCYICNRCLIWPIIDKMIYEIYYGRIPNISHLKVFDSRCYILNTKDQLNNWC